VAKPCDDLLVIDLSSGRAAGLATMVLADFGADVVKVEPPGGDPTRSDPASPMWLRGKRSVTLDLETAEAREALHRLVAGADVVVASYAPGKAAAHRADYETLSALNPALVYCSVTGWGPRGPYASYPVDETLVAAKSGRMRAFNHVARNDAPGFTAVQVGVHGAAQGAIAGILAALEVRDRSGIGQLVETSLLQGMFPFDFNGLVREQMIQKFPDKVQSDLFAQLANPDGMSSLGYQPIKTKDGKWIQFANLLEHLFQSSIVALGLTEEVLGDPQYAGAPNRVTPEAREEVRNMMLLRAREKTATEWMEIFKENGNVAADYVMTAQEALHHPDMVENGDIIERVDPVVGAIREIGPLAILRDTPAEVARPAPAAGADTSAVVVALRGRARSGSDRPPTGSGRAEGLGTGRADPPLAGVTVLEFATIIAAPLSCALLADLGARVIKIEPTNGGDPMRGMGGAGFNSYFGIAKTTAGKESICIDLKEEAGKEIVRKLVADADIIVHNYRPGVPERLGIGYEQAKAIKPDIIWVSVSGYGPDNASATKPCAHPIPGAVNGGALMQCGSEWDPQDDSIEGLREGARRFFRANEGNPDPCTSVVAMSSAMLALRARRRTGRGQQVFVSMLAANGYANADDFLAYAGKPARPRIDSAVLGTGPLRRLYRAREGWVCLSLPDEAQWKAFCVAAGRDDLAPDERFADAPARERNSDALVQVLTALFATRDADDWEHLLAPNGIGCVRADGYVGAGAFFLNDPQVEANGWVKTTKHPVMGEYRRWGPLVTFERTPGRYGPGVLAGQHTDAILGELGYEGAAVGELYERGVIWADHPEG
jgi:crotonobetainyl-CoA:carnitine CoA-transferase CaiB-like acyl-CoA transferase